MSETNGYRFLEFRAHPWRRCPYMKGTYLNVSILMPQYRACYEDMGEKGPLTFARNRGLPLEAVLEMIEWGNKNNNAITRDCREGYKRIKKSFVPQSKLRGLIKKAE